MFSIPRSFLRSAVQKASSVRCLHSSSVLPSALPATEPSLIELSPSTSPSSPTVANLDSSSSSSTPTPSSLVSLPSASKTPSLFQGKPRSQRTPKPKPFASSSSLSIPRPSSYSPQQLVEETTDPVKLMRKNAAFAKWWEGMTELQKGKFELGVKPKIKAARLISITMAKWYSDPMPYINRSALFGVDPNYIQPLDWKPVIGDRVRTSFNSYGTITALRPKSYPNPRTSHDPSSLNPFDLIPPNSNPSPKGGKKPKLPIPMPEARILRSSKLGADGGVVEKWMAEQARKEDGGVAITKADEEGRLKKYRHLGAAQDEMVAEVEIETRDAETSVAHVLSSLSHAPLSPLYSRLLLTETSHSSILEARRAGYLPPPPTSDADLRRKYENGAPGGERRTLRKYRQAKEERRKDVIFGGRFKPGWEPKVRIVRSASGRPSGGDWGLMSKAQGGEVRE